MTVKVLFIRVDGSLPFSAKLVLPVSGLEVEIGNACKTLAVPTLLKPVRLRDVVIRVRPQE